jgi:thioesterase domain-containing protein
MSAARLSHRSRAARVPIGSERELAEIFGEVLGVDTVGLDDDFFELGGDATRAAELANAVNERFGTAIDAATVVDAPTVARWSPRLTTRRPRGSPVVVPVLTPHAGVEPPFFCVAGGGAPALMLRPLAEAIGDRPFFGIQSRGLEERARPDRSVDAITRRSLDGVRVRQPSGPYLLGGHSFGGLVALELARQLEAAGERVALLVIFDTIAPPWASSREVLQRNLPSAGSENAASLAARRWASTLGARGSVLARAGYRRARRTVSLASAGIVRRRGLQQYDVFLNLSFRIGRAYRPDQPVHCPGLIVRGSDDEYIRDPKRALPALGWADHIAGPVSVLDVPGNHLSLMRTPLVAAVGAGLREAFAAAT